MTQAAARALAPTAIERPESSDAQLIFFEVIDYN